MIRITDKNTVRKLFSSRVARYHILKVGDQIIYLPVHGAKQGSFAVAQTILKILLGT